VSTAVWGVGAQYNRDFRCDWIEHLTFVLFATIVPLSTIVLPLPPHGLSGYGWEDHALSAVDDLEYLYQRDDFPGKPVGVQLAGF
jgi:hypothetical protein